MDAANNQNRNVLVVDDDHAVRAMISAALRSHGCEVTLANNGRLGAEQVHAAPERFSLIIMDYRMPEMNGVAASRIIRQCAPAVPIILMSSEKLAIDFDEIGVREFLPKPFGAPELIDLVDRHRVG